MSMDINDSEVLLNDKGTESVFEKSDVGFSAAVEGLKDISDLINKDLELIELINSIKSDIDDIFKSYLSIGYALVEIKENELYKLRDYDDFFVFTRDFFSLSDTTVKNVISIRKRFCDSRGDLLPAYKGFTYSALVELISVDEDEVSRFSPMMTVKDIRSVKLELKLNEMIDSFSSDFGSLSEIIQYIIKHPWEDLTGVKTDISYSCKKKQYEPDGEFLWRTESYVQVIFTLVFPEYKQSFVFSFTTFFKKKILSIESSSYHHPFNSFATLKDALNNMVSRKKHIFPKKVIASDTSVSNREKKDELSPGIMAVSGLFQYSFEDDSILGVFKSFVKKHFTSLYCEWASGYDELNFYEKPKRHVKKNPLLFKFRHINDPFRLTLEKYHNGVLLDSILIFDDFKEYYDKIISSKLETNLMEFYSVND